VANFLELPNAKYELGWRNRSDDPAVFPATPSERLCIRNASIVNATLIVVAFLTYQEVKFHHPPPFKRDAAPIARTTILIAAAALKEC
jgi:hypothetical protein